MVAHLASSLPGRAVALAIALLSTGAPRVASLAVPAPVHRCRCEGHGPGHACTCPVCALAARRAAGAKNRPSCHPGATGPAAATEGAAGGACACITGGCSPEDPGAAPSADPFVCPTRLRVVEPEQARERAGPLVARGAQARPPDVPPPRLG